MVYLTNKKIGLKDMKRNLFAFLLFFVLTSTIFAADYYWSGNAHDGGGSTCTINNGETLTIDCSGTTFTITNATIIFTGNGSLVIKGTNVQLVISNCSIDFKHTTSGYHQIYHDTGALWQGISFRGNSSGYCYFIDTEIKDVNTSRPAVYFESTYYPTSAPAFYNCTIGENTKRPGVGVQAAVDASGEYPKVIKSLIYAQNYALYVLNMDKGNYYHANLNYFISGSENIFFTSNFPNAELYAENNYNGGAAVTTRTNPNVSVIDVDPALQGDPTGAAGSAEGNPVRLGAGTLNAPQVDLYGVYQNTYYRIEGGNYIVNTGTTLQMGYDHRGDITAYARLHFDAATDSLVNNGTINFRGLAFREIRLGGASSALASIQLNNASQTNIYYCDINNIDAVVVNAGATVDLQRINSHGNTTGLRVAGVPASLAFSAVNLQNNTTADLEYNGAGTLTAENIYFGADPPNVSLFAGTGAIDYEPWSSIAYTWAGGGNPGVTQPVNTITWVSPTQNGKTYSVATMFNSIIVSGNDVGMYNGSPIQYRIEIYNSSGPTLIEFLLWSALVSNDATSTYNLSALPYTPGSYYWQIQARDPAGSNVATPSSWLVQNFIVGSPAVSMDITVNNITKAQSPAVNADAGDILEYIVSFNNNGATNADNAEVTNVLPTDVIFVDDVTYNITWATAPYTVTARVYDDNAGTSLVAEDIDNNPATGTDTVVDWTINGLTAVEEPTVRRITFIFSTVESGRQGIIRYRVRVR